MVEFDIKIERFRDKETGQLVSGRMYNNLFHAAASLSKDAKASIKQTSSPKPSPPGTPPRTRKRRFFQRAIRYEVDKQKNVAVIGPIKSVIGMVGNVMEFGGSYKGGDYPARPTMGRALEKNLHRFAGGFAGSIGG